MSTVVTFPAFDEVTHAIPFPVAPVHPCGHSSHLSPFGISKLNTAAELVPAFVTEAQHPASTVVVVPTDIVAAAPDAPVSPLSHFGIQKLNTAAQHVPLLLTVALHHGSSVVVVPIVIVPDGHCGPVSPLSPFKQSLASSSFTTFPSSSVKSISFPFHSAQTIAGQVCPVSPLSPFGIVKSSTAADVVPELVTHAHVPAAPVVVDPTVTVAAVHVSPFSPFRFEYCAFLILSPSSLSLNRI